MKLAIMTLPILLSLGVAAYAGSTTTTTTTTGGQTMATPAACSDDVQKYCASSATDADKQSCLHTNMDKLTAACRTAMNGSQAQQPTGY